MKARDLWPQGKEFLTYCQARNLSPCTINNYTRVLGIFREWLKDNHGEGTAVDSRCIREFMADGFKRGLGGNSIRTYLITLRAFYSYLELEDVITEQENPMRKVKNPNMTQRQIVPLTDEEVKALLDTYDKDKPTQYRDFVMCLLLLDTGLRASEISRLKTEDVDFEWSSLKVDGKGSKIRTVYMGQKMTAILQDYIESKRDLLWGRRSRANDNPRLFPPTKRNLNSGRLAPRHISEIIRLKMDKVGIKRARSSAHRLRHTFAVNFLRRGGGALHLQRLLGHSTLEMTRRYVLLAEVDLREAARKASPVDGLDF